MVNGTYPTWDELAAKYGTCRHPDCPDTNWHGRDRLHLRGPACPFSLDSTYRIAPLNRKDATMSTALSDIVGDLPTLHQLTSGATVLFRGDYTKIVTHFKVFREDDGQWSIDGRDDYGNYTESCWQYDTFEQAVAAIPEFAASIIEDGVEFFPRRNGNTVQVIGVRANDTMWEYLDAVAAESRYRAEIDYSVERGRNDTIEKYTGIRPADWPDLEDMRNGETVFPDFPPINYWVIQEAEVKP